MPEARPQAKCTKIMKFGRAVFELCEWTDRQTNTQTGILTTILHNPEPYRVEVITVSMYN